MVPLNQGENLLTDQALTIGVNILIAEIIVSLKREGAV